MVLSVKVAFNMETVKLAKLCDEHPSLYHGNYNILEIQGESLCRFQLSIKLVSQKISNRTPYPKKKQR